MSGMKDINQVRVNQEIAWMSLRAQNHMREKLTVDYASMGGFAG